LDLQIANNGSLASSNLDLQDSNNSLTRENAGLRESLKKSQEAEATSESKSTLLQRDLSDSTQSTIRAQADAKALEFEVGWLKVGLYVATPVAIAGVVYAVGHLLVHWW
jgi:hypothetical protein